MRAGEQLKNPIRGRVWNRVDLEIRNRVEEEASAGVWSRITNRIRGPVGTGDQIGIQLKSAVKEAGHEH